MDLSIIIPMYNEAPVISSVIDRLLATEMPAFVKGFEIIVVDDFSDDGSAEAARNHIGNNNNIRVITLPQNLGKGGAVTEGIKAAKGDTILVQDADLELDPSDIPALLREYHEKGPGLVTGTRFRNKIRYPLFSLPAVTINILFSLIASCLTLRRVTDITCGYKVFSKGLAEKLNLSEKRFGFETELMMKSLRDKTVRFGEQDVSYRPRRKGQGKKIRVADGLDIFRKIIKYGVTGRKIASKITIVLIIMVMLWNMISVKHWKEEQRVIEWDAISYYAYLPATFIYHDLSLSFIDGYSGPHKFIFWPGKSPSGRYVIKTSMGMAILWTPFFAAGHLSAFITGYDTGGYSAPYKLFLLISTLFYLCIGLIYLRKILLLYFSDLTVALTLAGFAFATNMYWYSLFQSTMAHVPGFALMTAFIWYSIQWHSDTFGGRNKRSATDAIRLGLLLGLISLIRPTNVIIIFVFLFYGISSWSDMRDRVTDLLRNYRYIILIAVMATLVWVPQMIYWKHMTGQWLYFSYGSEERFFWGQPALIKGLFGFRKGLFIYTPLLIFSFAGMITLWKSHSPLALVITIFIPVNIYIILSWWCWWYGGGFGQRAFIDSYTLMALPAASLLHYAFSARKILLRTALMTSYLLLVSLGVFNNIQYYHGAIHWDSMTRKAYFDSFLRVRPSPYFNQLLQAPDYDKARKGEDR